MPDLDFGDSDGEALIVLKGFAHRVNADLYNHGTKGLLTSFITFMADHAAREDEQKKTQDIRHSQNSTKINLAIAIGTLVLVVVTAVGIFVSYEIAQHAKLDPAHVFHGKNSGPVVAWFQPSQDAGNPDLR